MRNPIRVALERLSRGVVLERRFPRAHGGASIWVSPDVSLRFWKHNVESFDANLVLLARELTRPGDIVWDIGASVGLFALAAAFTAGPEGRVVAVEADPWVADLLGRSARSLPPSYAPIDVIAAAVADQSGEVELTVSSRGRAANHLERLQGSTQSGESRGGIRVPGLTLNELLRKYPAPALLKVDVEGAEELVLRGGDRVLERRPKVLCEVHATNTDAVTRRLHDWDYELFDADEFARPRSKRSVASWNTLALPKALDSKSTPVSPSPPFLGLHRAQREAHRGIRSGGALGAVRGAQAARDNLVRAVDVEPREPPTTSPNYSAVDWMG